MKVPAGSVDAYKAADYWKAFWNIEAFEGSEDTEVETFELVDGDVYEEQNWHDNVAITYTRSFANTNWQPLYVPFALSYEEWSQELEIAELAGVHMYDDGRNTKIEFLTVKSGEILPNVPYVVRAKAEGSVKLQLANRKLYAAPGEGTKYISCGTPRWTYKLYGNYQPMSAAELNGKDALVMGGGNFSSALSDLQPGRFYLKKEHCSNGYWGAPARSTEVIDIMIDGVLLSSGETTALLNVAADEEGETYNLNGIKVGAGYKGLVIKNGKKLFIK